MNGWQLFAVIGAPIVTGLFSYLIARNQNKTNLNKAKAENEVSLDEINNKHALALYEQYTKINADLSIKVDKLQSKMEKMAEELDNFKKKSEKEKSHLENRIDILEEENKDLRKENTSLKIENIELKEKAKGISVTG